MEKIWTDDMGEISGFGGSYEVACRAMVLAGIKWLDENPSANPKFKENKSMFGIIIEDNDDAKALTKAVTDAVSDCTGAMHHASIHHCLAYKELGWDDYCKKLKEE